MNKTITLLLIGVIFLALLLMMLNASRMGERHDAAALVTETAPAPAPSPGAPAPAESAAPVAVPAPAPPGGQGSAVLAPSMPQVAFPQAERSVAERARSSEGARSTTLPAQIDAGHALPASSPPPQAAAPVRPVPPPNQAMPEPSGRQTSGGNKNITNIVVFATQEGATLRLVGDRPLVYTALLLREPDRLVLDLEGHWNVTAPGIPQNRIIRAIRVGEQAESTRMVVDLHGVPASYRLIKSSPQGLDVRLR